MPKSKKSFSIPKLEFLTGEQMAGVVAFEAKATAGTLGAEGLESIFTLFEGLCAAPVRQLAMDQLFALFEAWSNASEVTPGESDGSATSSQSTD